MTKTIKFNSVLVNFEFPQPQPASRMIPEWFRKLPGVVSGIETIKKCMPFIDSMTSGYIITLAADVYVTENGQIQQITKESIVGQHGLDQVQGFDIPTKEYHDKPLKWMNFFTVGTPRGYSTLFTHPLNRIDLPFYSLSGVVETDMHPVPVNFPFFLKKDFVGIIPAGTPIIQAIPFKRTNWKSKVEQNKVVSPPIHFFANHGNPPFNYYKRHYWQRKTYN